MRAREFCINLSLSLSLSLCLLLSPSSSRSRGCANYTWQERKITPNGRTIEDEEGGYRGHGIYVFVDTRAYESEQY